MSAPTIARGPVAAAGDEREAVVAIAKLLAESARPAITLGPAGATIDLPPSVVTVLRQVVGAMAHGEAVTVVPIQKELTTQQAADILNVSRPYLVKLLDEGAIPASKTGSHRRVRLDDLLAYKRVRDAERREILKELTRMGQATGHYFDG